MQIANKFQKKIMSATDTPSDLNFSNLKIGRYYQITFIAHISSTTTANLTATHDGSIIAELSYSDNSVITVSPKPCVTRIFKATGTTITFSSLNISGDGTISSTYAILEERNDIED